MNTHKKFIIVVLAMSMLVLACSAGQQLTPTVVATLPVATRLLNPAPSPSPIPLSPTNTPPLTHFPKGFGVINTEGGAALTLCNLQGQPVAKQSTPGNWGDFIHISGTWPSDPIVVPVVYYNGEENTLELGLNDSASILAQIPRPNLIGMAGAPGQAVVAYSIAEDKDNQLVTHLYASNLANLPTATPVLTIIDSESYAILPLAVRAEGNQPVGVWYVYEPQGIGGDIVFPVHSGLYYLDLSNQTSAEILGRAVQPSSLSPDYSWLAFSILNGPLTIRNLAGGQEITLPLLPDSDRGAGYGVFAPDNQHVAWMEGRGQIYADPPADFHATIRIASTAGESVADIPDSTLTGAAGEGYQWVKPVGWLDAQTLVVQVGSREQNALIQVNLDGTNPRRLAPGIFAGFVFP